MKNVFAALFCIVLFWLTPTSSSAAPPIGGSIIDAVRNGQGDEVIRLLDSGAAIDTRDESGNALLNIACNYGHFKVAKLLVDRGADISVRNKHGRTPLHEAASMGDFETATLLIEKGADVKAVTDSGDTPLHFASEMRNLEMAEMVGAITRSLRSIKSTYEWKKDNVKVAELLIARGADINAQNVWGFTPLHRTTPWNNVEVAKLLLAHGARIDLKDNDGQIARDAARREGAREIVALIDERAKNN